jgi:very-short-patch-repair endonuclease
VGVAMAPAETGRGTILRARSLRRRMTEGERKLWSELKQFRRLYGLHVRKQAPVGPYIADFAIHSRNLVAEVDGEHHFRPEGLVRDRKRDAWFASQGYKVLRFTTGDLSDSFDGCIEEVLREVGIV